MLVPHYWYLLPVFVKEGPILHNMGLYSRKHFLLFVVIEIGELGYSIRIEDCPLPNDPVLVMGTHSSTTKN